MSDQPSKGRATGIGGIFFKSSDPEAVIEWYRKHLGLETNEYGAMFEFRLGSNPDQKGYLQWSPFKQDTDYFEPSKKEFMVNFRVTNIEGLVDDLREAGVTIIDNIQTYEYGKFVHILDMDGNSIELWEPIDKTFTDLYEGQTTL